MRGATAGKRLAWAAANPDRLAVAACGVVSIASNATWLAWVRRGSVLNIDEAAYLAAAWDDTTAFRAAGLPGLWRAWLAHPDFSPLVPLSAMPLQLVAGTRPLVSILVLGAWLVLLLAAVASITRKLTDARGAALAVVAVAGLPGVIDAQRFFIFALTAAALLAATVALLLGSARCTRALPTLLAGLAAGLALLARSMMVAIIPGAILVAVLLATRSPRRGRSVGLLLMGSLLGAAVAATWYLPNFTAISAYLSGYGYGSAATDFGPAQSPFEPGFWVSRLLKAERSELYLPASMLLAVGIGSLAVVAFRRRRRGGAIQTPRAEAALACSIVVAEGYLALTSTQNQGHDFELPLIPLVVCLAVFGLRRLPAGIWRPASSVAVVLLATLTLMIKTDLLPGLSQPRTADLPIVGSLVVMDGRGELLRYTQRFEPGTSGGLLPTAVDRAFPSAAAALDLRLRLFAHAHGREPIVLFATRDALLSSNHLGFAARYANGLGPIPVAQLTPRHGGDSEANYRERMSDPLEGQPNLLVTGDPSVEDFRPPVTQAFAEAAARELGFTPAFQQTLPTGRHLRVWWLNRGAAYRTP